MVMLLNIFSGIGIDLQILRPRYESDSEYAKLAKYLFYNSYCVTTDENLPHERASFVVREGTYTNCDTLRCYKSIFSFSSQPIIFFIIERNIFQRIYFQKRHSLIYKKKSFGNVLRYMYSTYSNVTCISLVT